MKFLLDHRVHPPDRLMFSAGVERAGPAGERGKFFDRLPK